jgi:cytochrome c peroxidase
MTKGIASTGTYQNAKEDILALIRAKNCAPIFVRLAWHDAGTYDKASHTGGPQATMRFSPVKDHGANNGLDLARGLLEPIKSKYPDVTYADLWSLAGVVAIEATGGPKIPWRAGRSDAPDTTFTPDGRLPDATQGQDHLRNIFYRMGLNDQDIVALSGAHKLGRCHVDRSGFKGPWTVDPLVFSNAYFCDLLSDAWEEMIVEETGLKQFWNKDKQTMMLSTDVCLLQDDKFRAYVELYAKDQDRFYRDFVISYTKLLELGREDSLTVVELN